MIGSLVRRGLLLLVLGQAGLVNLGAPSTAARTLADVLLRRFGRAAAGEAVESLAQRLERLVLRYGDDALVAVRQGGPGSVALLEQAGDHAPQAVRLLAQFGDEALPVVSQPRQLAQIARHGDDAARVLLRHQDVALPLLEAHAQPAVQALSALTPQNGRRLAMLHHHGDLSRIGRTPELLDVIARHGDRALEFVWRNKGALVVAVVLTRFLANPEPFLEGIEHLSSGVAESAVRPVAEIPGRIADEAAHQIDWTLLVLILLVAVLGWLLVSRVRLSIRESPDRGP